MATITRSSLNIWVFFHPLQTQVITSTTVILCSERGKRKKYLAVTERLGEWRMDWEIWERGGPPQCLMWYMVLSEDVSMVLTFSNRRSLSYKSQSIDFIIESKDWHNTRNIFIVKIKKNSTIMLSEKDFFKYPDIRQHFLKYLNTYICLVCWRRFQNPVKHLRWGFWQK